MLDNSPKMTRGYRNYTDNIPLEHRKIISKTYTRHRLACSFTEAEQLSHHLDNITHFQGLIEICAISQSPLNINKTAVFIQT